MHKSLNLGRRAAAFAAVLAVVGVFGLAHATLGLYQTPGTQYMGSWIWNDAATGTSQVDVRVKVLPPVYHGEQTQPVQTCVRNLRIEITGVAADGSQQTKTALVQIPAGFIRQVTVSFDHQLSNLLFVKILPIGPGTTCCL